MLQEYTFSMIKPDATERNLIGVINSYFEKNGLKIVAQKMLLLSVKDAKNFYYEHKEKNFFSGMIDFITSGPVILQVLKGEDAILKNRKIMGHTDPNMALPGTIRRDFGKSIEANSVHGSDSLASATREIAFFFAQNDIHG